MSGLRAWFRLTTLPGLGPLRIARLVERFGSAEAVLNASAEQLGSIARCSPRLARQLRDHRLPDWVSAELQLAQQHGYRIVPLTDPHYPYRLRQIADPPPLLYLDGVLAAQEPCIAVVGSRSATGYGLETAQRLAADLARAGLTVVSGLARGIDAAAHNGALQAGGRTIAVLGSGLNQLYPAEHRPLAQRIAKAGAVVSELPLAARPDAHHFPRRNRIISGLSLGVVVVEAAQRSGSLITARLAAEQGREVFAVPGNVHSFKSVGTHGLIQQGAKLVTCVQDILEELPASDGLATLDTKRDSAPRDGAKTPSTHQEPLSDGERAVLAQLSAYGTGIDELVTRMNIAPGTLAAILLGLELRGLVNQGPGPVFFISSHK